MKANKILEKEEEEEESASVSPLREGLFARFAYSSASDSSKNPRLSSPRKPGTQATGGKRKVPKEEDDVDTPGLSSTELGTQILEVHTPNKKAKRTGSSKIKYYHHLKALDDCLANSLDATQVLFCGINAGKRSAEIGHHYGNPTNHFWSCLYESGLIPQRLRPEDDAVIASKYGIGLTNLCHRPSVEQSEIAREEFVEGVPILLDKLNTYRPKILCFVGLGIADIFKSVAVNTSVEGAKVKKAKASLGLQPYKLVHDSTNAAGETSETLFYAVSSTSGRVVRYQKTEKVEQFRGVSELLLKVKNGTFDSSGLMSFKPTTLEAKVQVKDDKETPVQPVEGSPR